MTSVVWHINVSGSTRTGYQLRANLWATEVACVLSNRSIGTPTSVYISACWWLPEAYPWNQSEWILSLYKSDRPRNKLVEIMQHAYRHYIANADSLRTHESHVLGSQESQSIQRNRKKNAVATLRMIQWCAYRKYWKYRKPEDSWKAKSRG